MRIELKDGNNETYYDVDSPKHNAVVIDRDVDVRYVQYLDTYEPVLIIATWKNYKAEKDSMGWVTIHNEPFTDDTFPGVTA